jgi:hypothetical protein
MDYSKLPSQYAELIHQSRPFYQNFGLVTYANLHVYPSQIKLCGNIL